MKHGAGEPLDGERTPDSEAADIRRLVERAGGGDEAAIAEIIQAHQTGVFRLVARMVGDASLAEDLTQDVFLKAFRNLKTFRGESKLSTWLYRIAINLCRDFRASRTGRSRLAETSLERLADLGFDPPSVDPGPDEIHEGRRTEEAFRDSIDALGEPLRAAFLLRHLAGRSYEEIAEILSISKGNAKVRVHRAREAVLKSLRESGIMP